MTLKDKWEIEIELLGKQIKAKNKKKNLKDKIKERLKNNKN